MKRSKRVNRIKLTPFVVPVIKKPRRLILGFNLVLEAGLEPARPDGHRILSPACLPIPPLEQTGIAIKKRCMQRFPERKTGFEPATSTLARWRSTN